MSMSKESLPASVPAPPAISRIGPLVGLLASIAMCVQFVDVGGMGFLALILFGPLALLMFLPLALGLGLLWTGFVYLRRRQHRRGLFLFVGYAIVLLAVNHWWLFGQASTVGSSERALRSAEVLSIQDEAVSTDAGAPIGLRLVFDVRFPKRVVGNLSASAFAPSDGGPPWLFHLLEFRRFEQTILPAPDLEGDYSVFEKDVVYRVQAMRMPGSRSVAYRTGRPCREAQPGLNDEDILAALRQRGNRRYLVKINMRSDAVQDDIVVAEHQTSQSYDWSAMYQTILEERIERCWD